MITDRTFYSCVAGSFLSTGVSLTAATELAQLLAALVSIGIASYGFWHSRQNKKKSRGRRR